MLVLVLFLISCRTLWQLNRLLAIVWCLNRIEYSLSLIEMSSCLYILGHDREDSFDVLLVSFLRDLFNGLVRL